jgi:protein-S-isoprenylcysteine O-methyltransferase Ste14
MNIDTLISSRPLLFVVFTVVNVIYSWRSLQSFRVHGFYRFFIFEGVLILLLINGALPEVQTPLWFKTIARIFNAAAIVFVAAGYYQLRRTGGHQPRSNFSGNHHFENTAHLVNTGIYRFIRHPMYSSLLLFAWGTYLGYPTAVGFLVVVVTTIFVVVAARVEEQENINFFGDKYLEYMKTTKMFIPYLG